MSNFDLTELSELWKVAQVKPAVVQRNSDPLNSDSLVQHYARLTGMQYQVTAPRQLMTARHALIPHATCKVQRNSDLLSPGTLAQHYARLTGMQYQVIMST